MSAKTIYVIHIKRANLTETAVFATDNEAVVTEVAAMFPGKIKTYAFPHSDELEPIAAAVKKAINS